MDINEKIEARRRELASAKELERSKIKEVVDQQAIQVAAAKANEEKTVNSANEQQNKEKKHINEKNAPEEDADYLVEDELEKRITFGDKFPSLLGIIFAIILWNYDAGFIPVMVVIILSHMYLWHVKKTLRKTIIAEKLKRNADASIK